MTDNTTHQAPAEPIAVVGMACRFPDATGPAEFLELVLTGRRAFRRLPPARLDVSEYGDGEAGSPGPSGLGQAGLGPAASGAMRAALLEGWRFDRAAYGVTLGAYQAADPAHWLALETAARALADGGFPGGQGLTRDRTGVIIGNTLTGEVSRATALRTRWPYVRRVLRAALAAGEVSPEQHAGVIEHAAAGFLAPFPEIGDDTLAGSLPGAIADRICGHFGFRGGGHAVDAAHSSSLLAVAVACSALAAGDLDAAIAGGVDISLDPFELAGLAGTGVLARDEMRVFDARPTGFLPGEGCGLTVLMRAADARAAGVPVYAEIAGWGVSSAGNPALTRPGSASLLLALRRAYQRAQVDPANVQLIEGDGTGTASGDLAELTSLAEIRQASPRLAALGSVKANIGHTKAAAGAAGLIKTTLAIAAGIIPPATGCTRPHPLIASEDARLRVPETAEPWPERIRLAGVSSVGPGGASVHLVLRRARDGRRRRAPGLPPSQATAPGQDRAAAWAAGAGWGGVTAGTTGGGWGEAAAGTAGAGGGGTEAGTAGAGWGGTAAGTAGGGWGGTAAGTAGAGWGGSASGTDPGTCDTTGRGNPLPPAVPVSIPAPRVEAFAVSAPDRQALARELARVADLAPWLSDGELHDLACQYGRATAGPGCARAGLVAASQDQLAQAAREACGLLDDLAPGVLTAAPGIALADRGRGRVGLLFPGEGSAPPGPAHQASGASGAGGATQDPALHPAIVAVSLAALEWLAALGVKAVAGVGHGLGEITGLAWAGSLSQADATRLVARRAALLAVPPAGQAGVLCVDTGRAEAEALCRGSDLAVAAYNGPRCHVLAGPVAAVSDLAQRLAEDGIPARVLDWPLALYSPAMADRVAPMRTMLREFAFRPPARRLISTITGTDVTMNDDIAAMLSRQLISPVLFAPALERVAAEADLLIETGPGQHLATLAADCSDVPAFSLAAGRADEAATAQAAAALFASGAVATLAPLFTARLARPIDIWRERIFITNPCGTPAPDADRAAAGSLPASSRTVGAAGPAAEGARTGAGHVPAMAAGRAIPAEPAGSASPATEGAPPGGAGRFVAAGRATAEGSDVGPGNAVARGEDQTVASGLGKDGGLRGHDRAAGTAPAVAAVPSLHAPAAAGSHSGGDSSGTHESGMPGEGRIADAGTARRESFAAGGVAATDGGPAEDELPTGTGWPATGGGLAGRESPPGTGSAATTPGAMTQPDATTKPGTAAQPDAATKPGTVTEPGAEFEPGVKAKPGLETEPGMATRPGADKEPGAATEPGMAAVMTAAGTSPGSHAEPVPREPSHARHPDSGAPREAPGRPGQPETPGTAGHGTVPARPGNPQAPDGPAGRAAGGRTASTISAARGNAECAGRGAAAGSQAGGSALENDTKEGSSKDCASASGASMSGASKDDVGGEYGSEDAAGAGDATGLRAQEEAARQSPARREPAGEGTVGKQAAGEPAGPARSARPPAAGEPADRGSRAAGPTAGRTARSAADLDPPGTAAWVRCFTEERRPATPPEPPGATVSWRIQASMATAYGKNAGSVFADDPSADTVLAVLGDPAGPATCAALLGAAREAINVGRLVVIAPGTGLTGLCASLHAEHPGLGITLIRSEPDRQGLEAARPFATATPGRFREVILDGAGLATEPVMVAAEPAGDGTFPLGPADVVLLSGITRAGDLACATSLASRGAALAVIAPPGPEDPQMAALLSRLRSAGIRVNRKKADLSDPGQVAAAVRSLERGLGPVTAVVHAAAPGPVERCARLSEATLRNFLGSQRGRFANVTGAVAMERVRVLVTFGSVAARYGRAGGACDALASGLLAEQAARLGEGWPRCRVLHVDWAPWAEPEPAGRAEARPQAAPQPGQATPIPVDEGSRYLLSLLTTADMPARAAVHGRLGEAAHAVLAPTLDPPAVRGRFGETVRVHYPGVELIADTQLSVQADPYLSDYRIDDLPMLPAAMVLEAMAQAAAALAGRELRHLDGVRLAAPVLLLGRAGHEEALIRVCALRAGDTVETVLRCAETGFRLDHARAVFRPAGRPGTAPSPAGWAAGRGAGGGAPGGLVDGTDLYGQVFFQSGRFRRVAFLPEASSRACRALVRGGDDLPWFGAAPGSVDAPLVLGSPGLNDATLHVLQACLPHRRVLATGCESVTFSGREVRGALRVQAVRRPPAAGDATGAWDVVAADATGQPVVTWQGVRLRDVGTLAPAGAWHPALLAISIEARAGELGLDPELRALISCAAPPLGRGPAGAAADLGPAGGNAPAAEAPAGNTPAAPAGTDAAGADAGWADRAEGTGALAGFELTVLASRPVAARWQAVGGLAGDALLLDEGLIAVRDQLATRLRESPAALDARLATMASALAALGREPGTPLRAEDACDAGWILVRARDMAVASAVTRLSGVAAPVAVALASTPAPAGTAHGAAGPGRRDGRFTADQPAPRRC